jgi:hypothetical protein
MAEGDVPSPATTLIYFILVTLGFLIFTVFTVNKSADIVAINNSKDSNVINFIYILFIIIGSYFLNVHNSRMICDQSIEWNYILIVTVMPWLIIFVLLYFILKLFPGWVSPFSNTIGYMFVSMLGVSTALEKLIPKDTNVEEQPDLVKAINTIKNNKSKFINQIDINLSNFEDFISQLRQSKIIDYDGDSADKENTDIIHLYKLITIKHVIGKIVWYILAGILISSISYNYIIGISCEKSVDQIIKDYEEANPT